MRTISVRLLALLCALLLAASLLPMLAVAPCNHPYYDDLGFSIRTRAAWRESGSVLQTLAAAVENTVAIRQTWEGTYATSFLDALQPGVFGEAWYALTTPLLLLALLFALWRFLREALRSLRVGLAERLCLFCLTALVCVQLAPDAREAFFWWNGGMAYTALWALSLWTASLWLRLDRGGRGGWWTLALALPLTAFVAGGKYSTTLLFGLLALCYTLWAFYARRPKRFALLLLTCVFWAGVLFSATAPGNGVRAQTLGGGMSPLKAVLQALFFGASLLGAQFSLPVAALTLLGCALLLPALRQSGYAFKRPVSLTLLCALLYCAQLTPTLYTGNYLGDGRALNTYFYGYILLAGFLSLYWLGWLARQWDAYCERRSYKRGAATPAISERPRGVCLAAVALCLTLLFVGVVGFRPDGAESYGPQNTPGGSALRSLLSGEARAFDRAMDAREALLNDPAVRELALTPIENAPAVFMGDALDAGEDGYIERLLADYYVKDDVRVEAP